MLKLFFESLHLVARGLAATIGFETERNYVERPWTKEEEADFQKFCKNLGRVPDDPAHARLMEDGPIDFFNVDPWWDTDLPQA